MMHYLNSPNYNFCVVGGGTAGWLSALFIQRYFPKSNVTLIESSDIGILGAGEGTTPHFLGFLDELNIPLQYIVQEASATFKNGIKFTNYNGDGLSYFHGFKDNSDLDYSDYTNINYHNIPILAVEEIAKGNNLDSIDFSARASAENKVRYDSSKFDPFLGHHALHFNAAKLAEALKKIGIERNIKVIDGIVDTVDSDENGNITSLNLKDQNISCNFLIDCTGFKRFFIGKHYESKWKSYKHNLPVKRAIPFFLNINENQKLPPYTEAIAMKYGWMWKIPTQERFGCGYVFDNDMISDDDAKEEIDKLIGFEVESPRQFNFSAGCFQKTWIKNCVAVGLSSGFIEPKEATSIWVTIQQLRNLLPNIQGITDGDSYYVNRYNEKIVKITDQILDFIYLHYVTNRKDTEFWRNFTANNIMPDNVKNYLEECRNGIPNFDYFKYSSLTFDLKSYYAISAGLNHFEKRRAVDLINSLTQGISGSAYIDIRQQYLERIGNSIESLSTHAELINKMR